MLTWTPSKREVLTSNHTADIRSTKVALRTCYPDASLRRKRSKACGVRNVIAHRRRKWHRAIGWSCCCGRIDGRKKWKSCEQWNWNEILQIGAIRVQIQKKTLLQLTPPSCYAAFLKTHSNFYHPYNNPMGCTGHWRTQSFQVPSSILCWHCSSRQESRGTWHSLNSLQSLDQRNQRNPNEMKRNEKVSIKWTGNIM